MRESVFEALSSNDKLPISFCSVLFLYSKDFSVLKIAELGWACQDLSPSYFAKLSARLCRFCAVPFVNSAKLKSINLKIT